MKRFDRALEDCLERTAHGESLEECLQRYPQFAGELLPLLKAADRLERVASTSPSEGFRERGRAQLIAYMQAHPHDRNSKPNLRPARSAIRGVRPAWTMGIIIASVIFAFFVTGTAVAQSALPGQALYGWKLTSEAVWRAVSPDPVSTDLALARRRAQEALAVSGSQRKIAVQGYEEVLSRLARQSLNNPSIQTRIVPILTVQREKLEESGISVPKLDEYLSQPTPTPAGGLPAPGHEIPHATPARGAQHGTPAPSNGTEVPGP